MINSLIFNPTTNFFHVSIMVLRELLHAINLLFPFSSYFLFSLTYLIRPIFILQQYIQAREEYRFIKYRKQIEWAVGVIQKNYILWKRRHFLITLPMRLQANSLSPISTEWPSAPKFLAETSQLLKTIFHRWRVSLLTDLIVAEHAPVHLILIYILRFQFRPFSATDTEKCLIKQPGIECGKK